MNSKIQKKISNPSLRRLIVIRNTPDWGENANLWKNEGRVDPSRFLPSPLPPGFPEDTVQLILCWNRIFTKDFFSVREEIKNMALSCFKEMKPDRILTQHEFEADPISWAKNSIIFFTDDDDFARHDLFDIVSPYLKQKTCVRWPSPVLRNILINRRVENTLPFFRLWLQKRAGSHPVKLGFLLKLAQGRNNLLLAENKASDYILQTNNYAINLSGLNKEQIFKCIDHVKTSRNIRPFGIKLISLESHYLSFTNKLPSSISQFRAMKHTAKNDVSTKALFSEYIQSFSNMLLPVELLWAKKHQKQLTSLFNHL